MIEPFLIKAALGGFAVALAAGPLGCFVVWRRMAYFGDSLAHSALLGVAFGFAIGIATNLATLLICFLFAFILAGLEFQKRLATDTLLGILSHSALALGLVTISLLERVRVDLFSYLFGDILSLTWTDVSWIAAVALASLIALGKLWNPLLLLSINEDLSEAEGISPPLYRIGFMLLIAALVAIAMKVVGILLITALLIIPAATARQWSRSPEAMAVGAAFAGLCAILGGLWSSFQWDLPTGPAIVLAASSLFLASFCLAPLVFVAAQKYRVR